MQYKYPSIFHLGRRESPSFLATMSPPSYTLINQMAHNPYTPPGSFCRASNIGELSHTWSKMSLQSRQESLSNDSTHTTGATNYKDSVFHSGQGVLHSSPNTSWAQDFSVYVCKSCHALQKSTSYLRNQSLSTVCTGPSTAHNHYPIATSISEQEASYSDHTTIENRAASSLPSTLCSSPTSALSLATDPVPSPVFGASHSTLLDGHSAEPCSDPPAHRRSTASHFHIRGVKGKRDFLSVPEKQSNISRPVTRSTSPMSALTLPLANLQTCLRNGNGYCKTAACPRSNNPRLVRPFTRPTSLM